jgi:hypothetical protein
MNAHPHLSRSDVVTMIIAGALSTFIAMGGLSAFAGLFLRDGTPYEQVLAAERPCTNDAPVSKREACPRPDTEGTPVSRVAGR